MPGPQPRERPKGRKPDCCDQILELLGGLPGLTDRKLHKPKQRPARKIQAMCDALQMTDAVLPLIAELWSRFEEGDAGRNDFEREVDAIFGRLEDEDAKCLGHAFAEYRKLRRTGKADCFFNDCLADASREGPVERSWVVDELLREGLKVAGMTLFENSKGIMGPGQARLWDLSVERGPNGSGATIYQGPWPWLTAIATDLSSYEEFGNTQSFRPAPGTTHLWQNYQYAQECTFTPDPSGAITTTCARKHPTPPPPGGGFGGSLCEGGLFYTVGSDCLRIPAQAPGGSIKLRGFNFITPTVKVRLALVSDPSVFVETDCTVWGDQVTPLKDADEHFIVDERVSDWIDCPIPSKHPTISGAPLPAGLYALTVKVSNTMGVVYDSRVPTELESNLLYLVIEADPKLLYSYFSPSGRCNRETDGLGSDEIWWDAFTGHIVPTDVPVPADGSAPLNIAGIERRSFDRGAWNDMDSGESAGGYNASIWGPKAFELYGVAVIALVGFEVDSESAARDQLQGFWNAWGQALADIVGVAFGAGGMVTGLAKLAVEAGLIAAKLALTVSLIAIVVIAVLVLIGTALWASWAPADLVALDLKHFDARTAWDRTDPKLPLPPGNSRTFGSGDSMITMHDTPKPKIHKAGDAAATWIQQTQYDTPEDGEDSSYTLDFRLART